MATINPPPIKLQDWQTKDQTVVISGHDLPEPPIQWGGETNVEVTKYGGTEQRSAQMLGREYKAVELSGRFSDIRANKKGHARDAKDALEELWKQLHLVRFEYGPEVRWGYIDAEFGEHWAAEIDYKLKFHTLYLEDPDLESPPSFRTSPKPAADAVRAKLAEAEREADKPNPVAEAAAEALKAIYAAQNAMSRAIGVISDVEAWADLAIDEARGVATQLGGAVGKLEDVAEITRGGSFQAMAGAGPEEAAAARYLAGVDETTTAARADLLRLLREFLGAVEPPAREEHVVGDGDTLERLAQEYLGDWTRWHEIAEANDLEATDLERGQILEIPEK